jgi:hypothetical protein
MLVESVRSGHLAPIVQNLLKLRGFLLSSDLWTKLFGAFLDQRSLGALLLLNSMESSISGLVAPLYPKGGKLDLAKWHPTVKLVTADLRWSFLYTLVSTHLKRLDTILKGSISIAAILANLPAPKSYSPDVTAVLFPGITGDALVAKVSTLPSISVSHPIILASENEVTTILSILSSIRTGNTVLINQAQVRLVEILISSHSERYLPLHIRASRIRRTLVNGMLSTISRACLQESKGSVHFSLQLSTISRMWSLSWTIGGKLTINVVQSRVNISTTYSATNLERAQTVVDPLKTRI